MRASKKQEDRQAPGAFRPDGSWNERGELVHRGPFHALVARLVARRRGTFMTPAEAAAEVRQSNFASAFPNLEQWERCEGWWQVVAGSAAEETVKRAEVGSLGHWCRDQWVPGLEKDCGEPVHDAVAAPAGALSAIQAVGARLAPNPAEKANFLRPGIPDADEPPPAEVAP